MFLQKITNGTSNSCSWILLQKYHRRPAQLTQHGTRFPSTLWPGSHVEASGEPNLAQQNDQLNRIWVPLQQGGSNAEQLTAPAAGCGPAPGNTRPRVYLNCHEDQLKPTRVSSGHFLLLLISRRGQCLISQERQDVNKRVLEKTLHLKLLPFFLSAAPESNMRFFSSPLHSGNRLYPSISISEKIIFV